jgi:pimeloyl-ACP methyl ester carboxylesterase
MPVFRAGDGTELAYHVQGEGAPLVCLPGGRRFRRHREFDGSGTTRAALAAFTSPVLVLAGEVDLNTPPRIAAEVATLFPNARLIVQPGAGHYPWLDHPTWFTSAVAAFLDDGR